MVTVGIDEVGRGCWAGPLVAAAVILDTVIPGLKDSKLLTKKARAQLAPLIMSRAQAAAIGWVTPAELDAIGLTSAVTLAMARALDQISHPYQEIIIDGPYNFLPAYPAVRTIIKADVTIPAVSAASIIAKVARDNYMTRMAMDFPQYRFESHVGYGTAAHKRLLHIHGPCRLHRVSYRPVKECSV